jgi:hypothetical protein
MSKLLDLLKQWWPSIIAAAGALWTVFGTQIQAYVTAHPSASAILAALGVIIAHLVPSPVTAKG